MSGTRLSTSCRCWRAGNISKSAPATVSRDLTLVAAPLYRQFDRADLDREYSPSLLTGGKFESDLADYARLSARLPGVVGFMPDIAYGDHPDEILDLLLPPGTGPWPLHIFIHGGYWQAHSQRDFAFIGPAFQKRGVAYASLNYTIAPAATIGAMIAQCRRAVAWLHANAARSASTGTGSPCRATAPARISARCCSPAGTALGWSGAAC